MPGYKLHHSLFMEKIQSNYYGGGHYKLEGGGRGLTGGYYAHHHHNHPQQQQQQQQQQQSHNDNPKYNEQKELIGGSIKFLLTSSTDDWNLNQQRLFSSTTNHPFARHDLTPITTPYGMLHFTALYDDGLNVERVMMDRARRLMEWDNIMIRRRNGMESDDGGGGGGSESMTTTKAIPIQVNNNRDDNQNQLPQHQQQLQNNSHQGLRRHSSYQPQAVMMTMNSNRHPSLGSTPQQQFHHHNNYHHQQQNHYNQYDRAQPMSLPNNVISEHLIQNYARSLVMNNGDVHTNKNNTNDNVGAQNTQQIRERLSSDPLNGLQRRDSGSQRVLSGLSLALMNDEKQQHKQELVDPNPNQSLSSSPNTSQSYFPTFPTTSSEEAASWKQRVALHHPPPSFDPQHQIQQAVSSSPHDGQNLPASTVQRYGYGYNQGKAIPVPVPSQTGRDCNSPIPNVPMTNTPPQPLFIESLPRGSEHTRKSMEDNSPPSPPFRNPTSLTELPSTENSIFQNNKSYMQQQQQQSQKFQTIGASGALSNNAQGRSFSAADTLLLPPLTTMDGLCSSPFKFPTSVNGPITENIGSTFSSLTLGKGSAMMFGHDSEGIPMALASGMYGPGSGFVRGTGLGQVRSGRESSFRSSYYAPNHDDDDEDDNDNDMPFAVDDQINSFGASATSATNIPMGMSSGIVSSDVVTSLFAHRCATAGPLKLFKKSNNVNAQDEVSKRNQLDYEKSMASLSSQLDELKSFGESIMSST